MQASITKIIKKTRSQRNLPMKSKPLPDIQTESESDSEESIASYSSSEAPVQLPKITQKQKQTKKAPVPKEASNPGIVKFSLKNVSNFMPTSSMSNIILQKFTKVPNLSNRDVYTHFVTGSSRFYKATITPKIIDEVEELKKRERKEKMMKGEFIVDRPARLLKQDGSRPNRFEAERLKKELKRTEAKSFLQAKWQRLQNTRLGIISHLKSCKYFASQLEALEKENLRLAQASKETKEGINKRISERLEENQQLESDAIVLFYDFVNQQKACNVNWIVFEKSCNRHLKNWQDLYTTKNHQYMSVLQELTTLEKFKKISETNPEVLQAEIKDLMTNREATVVEEEKLIEFLRIKGERDIAEIEQDMMDQIAKLGMEAGNFISSVDKRMQYGRTSTPLAQASKRNKKIKLEISLHLENQVKIDEEITRLEKEREEILRRMVKLLKDGGDDGKKVDSRRKRVLNLKAFQTCTPDMEFTEFGTEETVDFFKNIEEFKAGVA